MTIGQLRNLLAEIPDTVNISLMGYDGPLMVEETTRKKNGVVTVTVGINEDYENDNDDDFGG